MQSSLGTETESVDLLRPDPGGAGEAFLKNIVDQLLDLSRRNPSLNFRLSKGALSLAGTPESLLATLTRSIAPIPVETLLEAPPSPEQLKTLRRLSDRARLLMEERGVQALHIGFGLLHWKDPNSAKTYNAPVILLPVTLHRSGDVYSIQRIEGADPEPNRALIELMRRQAALDYEERDPSSEQGYSETLACLTAALENAPDLGSTDECYIGLFSYEKLVMVDDIETNAESIMLHPLIAALNGDPEPLALSQHGIESPLPPELDQATTSADRVYIVDADSSQQEALEAIARGLSNVVQGPPGTGKSQTIVNIIAQALFDGRSVLFVAEKKVALDVVIDRLSQRGLGDLLLPVQRNADKKRFAVMLGLRHTELASSTPASSSFNHIAPRLAELNAYREQLHEPVGLSNETPFELYGRHAQHVRDTPRVRIPKIDKYDPAQRELLANAIERLAGQPSWLLRPNEAVWASLRPEIDDLGVIHAALEPMENARRCAVEIAEITAAAADIVGPSARLNSDGLDLVESLLDLVAAAPRVPPHWLDADPKPIAAALERYEMERATYETQRQSLLTRYKEGVLHADLGELTERFLHEYDRFWKRWFNKLYAVDANSVIQQRLDDHRTAMYADLRQDLTLLQQVNAQRSSWASSQHEMRVTFGDLFIDAVSAPAELRSYVDWLQRFAAIRITSPPHPVLCTVLVRNGDTVRARARELLTQLRVARSGIAEGAALLEPLFVDLPDEPAAWASYLDTKISAMEEAPRYCQYRRWVALLRESGCGPLLDAIMEYPSFGPEHWRTLFERVADASLIDYAHRSRSSLAAFDREAHEQTRTRYAEMDEQNVEKGAQRVLARTIKIASTQIKHEAYRPAADLIMREARKAKGVMPIRSLTRRAFDAIRVLKPCWVMSPLAVSQYLPPGQVFDLVVFDEASQMRPADAIPALSRARQVVIVGDHKQLPPTSFFDNALTAESSDGEEEERPDLADYESILDRCAAVLQQRMLRWHYRSRDEALIAFSNDHFYDHRLVTFPTPAKKPGFGVRSVLVESTYARGGSRQNRGEALEVARLAYEHARTRPLETLGIIAFSQAQQRAIEDALEQLAQDNPDCASFFADSHPANERVFIKNLESVQGDERDVILLSVGYGRDEYGKLSYNFGPLNRAGGERRLNVAITRAKNELIVVSSIDDRDLDAEKCREGGASLIRSYLGYVRNDGSVRSVGQSTGRGADSPFEEDVRLVLASMGHKVHTQVGASGYRLDLAVCHPERDGEYMLAIECDGATYHGTPTARDRDRLRDRTLRSFGWRIHRIWSRDWFRRRADEITRLREAVDAAFVAHDNDDFVVPSRLESGSLARVQSSLDDRSLLVTNAATSVCRFLERHAGAHSKSDIVEATSLPEPLVSVALDYLISARTVKRIGAGRGTKYQA